MCLTYTVLHMFRQLLFWARSRLLSRLRSILATQESLTDFYGDDILKKTELFNSTNSQYFFSKNLGIGPWVNRINFAQPILLSQSSVGMCRNFDFYPDFQPKTTAA